MKAFTLNGKRQQCWRQYANRAILRSRGYVSNELMDTASAVQSYNESGIENTYLYLDVRQYMKSSAGSDPDLSSTLCSAAASRWSF